MSKQGPIFLEGTITNQQQPQAAGHWDTTFFQKDEARPHTVNVILDVLYDFGTHPVESISRGIRL
jgi:hypothetical protein